jgi:hypothetical protein
MDGPALKRAGRPKETRQTPTPPADDVFAWLHVIGDLLKEREELDKEIRRLMYHPLRPWRERPDSETA